jgi:hypothetical protein
MISYGYKSLFATVLMAITLARSAPLQDTTGGPHMIEVVAAPQLKDAPVEVGNHSMHITSPSGVKEHHHHHSQHQHHHQQAQLVPDGEDYAAELSDEIPTNGEELAEHVINLRDYIETLSDDEFEGFMEHYMENASKDDMFALELALELDADDRDEEDDFDHTNAWDSEDDEDAIKFVPYSQVKGDHHRHHRQRAHNHRLQHRFEREVGCDEEEIELGLCEPSLEFEKHPHHHRHHHRHGHHHHEQEDELMCSQAEFEQGLCGEIQQHRHHHGHHHSHLRHGQEVRSYEHPSHHQVLTKADGFPFGDNLTHLRHNQRLNDADLLGKPQFHVSAKPLGVTIIEHALPGPAIMVGKPDVHPVKIAEVHVQEVPSLAPRDVKERVSGAPF